MLREFKNNPYFRFTFLAILLYVFWYIVYEAWLHPSGLWDQYIINSLVNWSDVLLNILGYTTLNETDLGTSLRIVGIDGTSGVWIGDACNGFSLFALFVIFMLTYPGPWKNKWWFTLLGIVIIHFVNVIRITALAILVKVHPDWLYFNHNYTFTIVVYSVVFLLWWVWAKKYAAPWLKQKEDVATAQK